MKRQHGRQVRAAVQAHVVRRAPASPNLGTSPTTPAPAAPGTPATSAVSPALTVQADQIVAGAMQHHRAGRLAEAEAQYRQALALDPNHAEANHLLGLLAHQVGQFEMAVVLIGRAIAVANDRPLYYLNLGAAFQASNRLDLAIQTYRQAVALRPDFPEALNNLGVALQAQGSVAEAIPCFERAIALRPAYAEAHFNLGAARQAEDRNDLAVECYRAALALRPDYLAAQYNLGNALLELRQFETAVASYRATLALDPGHVDAHNNLGLALMELKEGLAAIASFEQAVSLQPEYANAHINRGNLLRERGRLDEAIHSFRTAQALQPDDEKPQSGIILALDHHEACTPAQALAERRVYNDRYAAALTAAAPPHTNNRDAHRPLRVGYFSVYFTANSSSLAFGPILAHDPAQVEVYCYADVTQPDHRTTMFKQAAAVWRDVVGWSNEALAEQIRADQIDILVDLDGHSGCGKRRLLAFARKPAPIQVTAWGYCTGTGLDAVDVLFSDEVVIPPSERRWYAEEIVYLPTMMNVETIANPPAVAPSPAATNGTVTFGAFCQVIKLSPAVLDTWAAIVAAVPGARMLLKYPGMDDPETLAMIRTAFEAHGVGPERVEVRGKTTRYDHLAAYGEVDIQLDPYPHGGGVTTFEGLLMGVPSITLLGDRISGRATASFLTTVGLPDLVARSLDEYAEIAVRLAGDADRLARERATLRGRLLASPIADRDQFTRAVESAYRDLWRRWCDGQRGAESRA